MMMNSWPLWRVHCGVSKKVLTVFLRYYRRDQQVLDTHIQSFWYLVVVRLSFGFLLYSASVPVYWSSNVSIVSHLDILGVLCHWMSNISKVEDRIWLLIIRPPWAGWVLCGTMFSVSLWWVEFSREFIHVLDVCYR